MCSTSSLVVKTHECGSFLRKPISLIKAFKIKIINFFRLFGCQVSHQTIATWFPLQLFKSLTHFDNLISFLNSFFNQVNNYLQLFYLIYWLQFQDCYVVNYLLFYVCFFVQQQPLCLYKVDLHLNCLNSLYALKKRASPPTNYLFVCLLKVVWVFNLN